MDATQLDAARPLSAQAVPVFPARRRAWRAGLQGSEFTWAVAFLVPYVALFLVFVAHGWPGPPDSCIKQAGGVFISDTCYC
jgi:hypothetical protein